MIPVYSPGEMEKMNKFYPIAVKMIFTEMKDPEDVRAEWQKFKNNNLKQ